MDRQKSLTRRDPLRFKSMIHENALRERIGNEDIMSDQYDHLLEISRLPNVSMWVVRSNQGYHPGLLGSFIIYEYEQERPIVYLEHYHTSGFSSDDRQASSSRRLVKTISGIALSEDASRDLIAEVAR